MRGKDSGQWVCLLVTLNHWLSDAVSLIVTQGWRWDSQMTYEKFVITQQSVIPRAICNSFNIISNESNAVIIENFRILEIFKKELGTIFKFESIACIYYSLKLTLRYCT